MDVEETTDKQNDIEMEEDNSSNSTSEESDNDGDENDEVINKLTEQVLSNPYYYDGHVQLINAAKGKGDLEKLRSAREKMSELFPLTEELWLDWIKDEISLAISKEEKIKICDLFEKSVKDYMSVNLWVEYAQFSIGIQGDMETGLEKCREVFERGITAVGIHVTKGWLMWEAFREFELIILNSLKTTSEDDEDQKSQFTKQKDRIINLYKRQLSVPLLDMKSTYKEMAEFVGDVSSNIQLGYNKALAKLEKILPYEDALTTEESTRSSSYLSYIDFELSEEEPARIQCLFERSIVDNCLSPNLWKKYTEYLYSKLNIESVIIPVYERALRNCPWSLEIWQGYLRTLERYEHPSDKIKNMAEKAFSSGFTTATELRHLWMTYLEYLRRQIKWNSEHQEELELLRSTFERANLYLTESFGYEGDPQMEVLQFWARVEARHCNNMEKARGIWNDIMQHGHAKYANMWLEFICLERMFGDVKHTRKTFARAIQAASDWPETIGEAWINFERDEGDLGQFEAAISKVNNRITVITEQRQKAEENSHKKKDHSGVAKSKKSKLTEANSDKKTTKRKIEDRDKGNAYVDADGFAVPPPKRHKVKSESVSTFEENRVDTATKKIVHDSSKDDRTVFLSNLSYDVNEEQIKEFFSNVGEIVEVRLVKTNKGLSRGYCYVEFLTADLASNALKKDRGTVNGRPVFVSKCKDKKNEVVSKQFKYATGIEKKKLFVRGLPFTLTQEQLVNMFKIYGNLKEARLVTYRNGNSKGLAYVEYDNEFDASTALVKADGLVIDSNPISVAISNPPNRNDREKSGSKSDVISLGGGDRKFGQRGNARTKLSFVPRALNIIQSDDNEKNQSSTLENGGNSKEDCSKPLSNSDFRSLLYK